MNYLCQGCGCEFSDDDCHGDPYAYGCPECGGHDGFDEEVQVEKAERIRVKVYE